MSTQLETTIKRFIGLSTDIKPDGVPAGSSFLETDTGRIYRYSRDRWESLETYEALLDLQQRALAELRAMRQQFELITGQQAEDI